MINLWSSEKASVRASDAANAIERWIQVQNTGAHLLLQLLLLLDAVKDHLVQSDFLTDYG